MPKVIPLPVAPDGPLAIPLADGALLRLVPCRDSPHVLLALYGPRGGNAGGVVLHAERARVLGAWLERLAAHYGVRGAGEDQSGTPAPTAASFPDAVPTLLGTALDAEAAAAGLARLAVPSFADWWSLDLVEPKGSMRRLAIAHADGSKERAARELARYAPDPQAAGPRTAVLRTGVPNVARRVSEGRIAASAHSNEHLELLRSVGCRSSIVVPLVVRRRVIGLMTFVTAESGRRYDEGHLSAAVAFGQCAALAVSNALLYRKASAALSRRQDEAERRRPDATRSR